LDNFIFSFLLKQEQNGLKTNQTSMYGQSNAAIVQDAATSSAILWVIWTDA
jgi:hypothetical protein